MPCDAPLSDDPLASVLRLIFEVRDIPPKGIAGRWRASREEESRAAAVLGITALSGLNVEYTVRLRADGSVAVAGSLKAGAEQACVVTSEPVLTRLDEDFNVLFSPAVERADLDAGDDAALDHKAFPAGAGDELPEPLSGGHADLGRYLLELLSLSIDPYPRKPGAILKLPATLIAENEDAKPFAALAKLKKPSAGS